MITPHAIFSYMIMVLKHSQTAKLRIPVLSVCLVGFVF